jgi:hypothetical protein
MCSRSKRGAVAAESDRERLADELALRNLICAVAHASDAGTLEEFGSHWTDDAVLSFEGVDQTGKDAVVATAVARRTGGMAGPQSAKKHMIGTIVVHHDGGDEATVDSYVQLWNTAAPLPEVVQMVRYRDTARRGSHGWKLSRREVTR